MPLAVMNELADQDAPPLVRAWIANRPLWVEVREVPCIFDETLARLDDGEREAIALAVSFPAESLLLMDDREGAVEARRRGLAVTGTLGVLIRNPDCWWHCFTPGLIAGKTITG